MTLTLTCEVYDYLVRTVELIEATATYHRGRWTSIFRRWPTAPNEVIKVLTRIRLGGVALGHHHRFFWQFCSAPQQLRDDRQCFTANMPASLIGMEACSGSHFLGRALAQQGHNVRLIPAQFVKPFLKSHKNDYLDAEAIAEASSARTCVSCPSRTDDQLDLQALHRVREQLVSRRTAVMNQVRAFLLERGIVFRLRSARHSG